MEVTLLGSALSSVALIGAWGSVQWIPSWADKLTGGTNPGAKADVQMVFSFAASIGAVPGPVLLGWLPRRVGYALLCASSLGACAWLFRGEAVWGSFFLVKVGLTASNIATTGKWANFACRVRRWRWRGITSSNYTKIRSSHPNIHAFDCALNAEPEASARAGIRECERCLWKWYGE